MITSQLIESPRHLLEARRVFAYQGVRGEGERQVAVNILKVKDSHPEMFEIERTSDDPKGFWRTEVVTEDKLREIMASHDVATIEIDASIKQARKNEGQPVSVAAQLRNIDGDSI